MSDLKTEAAYIVDLFKQREVLLVVAGLVAFLLAIALVRFL